MKKNSDDWSLLLESPGKQSEMPVAKQLILKSMKYSNLFPWFVINQTSTLSH